eukprot:4816366-Pleurochrysis_carterae.AAC.1
MALAGPPPTARSIASFNGASARGESTAGRPRTRRPAAAVPLRLSYVSPPGKDVSLPATRLVTGVGVASPPAV